MRVYKNAIITTFLLTVVSFFSALYLNFFKTIDAFWYNALLGIFGSSLLTLITSVISYRVERRKTFEGFSYCTKVILHDLNKYQSSWELEKKIDFFLEYHDISHMDWDSYFGNFCFLFDFKHKCRNYIYTKIYKPILTVNQAIANHLWHFRWHKDGSGRNEKVMQVFVKEIEDLIITTVTETYPCEDAVQNMTVTSTKNKLISDIQQELNDEYYRLMYGNKIYRKNEPKKK